MDRLLSALVLGIYLASCAPALPPTGSAAFGADEHASSASRTAGRSAAKGELPDTAREERLVKAWEFEAKMQGVALEQALKELIPEMRHMEDRLYPAPGFDPESVWKNAAPHTYVYQVSRGNVAGGGQSWYDVRQAGFLFSRVEELVRIDTAYIRKAELLAPYFMLCFDEAAVQQAAGNSDPDYNLYPLVKRILDKGLNPAGYVSYKAYYDLYEEERIGKRVVGTHEQEYIYLERQKEYRDEINIEHRAYLWEYEVYVADTEQLLEPGETRLDREYIAGQGIDFASPDFEERLNSYSVRKSAFENVGDILDGYWEALRGAPVFRRAFERAVGSVDSYLAAAGVVADVNLPTYFKCRYNIPVYRCYAPYLAVCGAAQAFSYGWLQTPVVAANLSGKNNCWLDVPRISSADSNKLGIQYTSFEEGRGNGQDGFSGYEDYRHVLDRSPGGEWRPDKFSMGAFEIRSLELPKYYAAQKFIESYYQCNFPYKVFSRAALKGIPVGEAMEVVLRQAAVSVPKYWQDRFHGQRDHRKTIDDTILFFSIFAAVADIASIAYSIYQAYALANAVALGVEAVSAAGEITASAISAGEVLSEVAAGGGLISSSSSASALPVWEVYAEASLEYVGPTANFYRLVGTGARPGMVFIPLQDATVYMVPEWMTVSGSSGIRILNPRYRIITNPRRARATVHFLKPAEPKPLPNGRGYRIPDEHSLLHFNISIINSPLRPERSTLWILQRQDIDNALIPAWVGFPQKPTFVTRPFP